MAEIFTMPVGDFYTGEDRKDIESAGPTAEQLLRSLTISPPGTDPAGGNYEKTKFALGNTQPARFRAAGGEASYDDAHYAVSSALGVKYPYWFDKYATDPNVTSDGTVIRWQSVKIYEDQEDRSQFDGLWQWELRRTGESSYWFTVRRIQ